MSTFKLVQIKESSKGLDKKISEAVSAVSKIDSFLVQKLHLEIECWPDKGSLLGERTIHQDNGVVLLRRYLGYGRADDGGWGFVIAVDKFIGSSTEDYEYVGVESKECLTKCSKADQADALALIPNLLSEIVKSIEKKSQDLTESLKNIRGIIQQIGKAGKDRPVPTTLQPKWGGK